VILCRNDNFVNNRKEARLKRALLLTPLLLIPFSSPAITLKQAEELAVKNYPKIKEFELLKESSKKAAESIKRERFGTLNLLSSYTTYNKNFILIPMYHMMTPKNPPPFNSRKLIYGVDYSIPLYLGGTISKRVEIEKVKSSLFGSLKKLTSWQVKFNVDSVYLGYLKLEKVKKALFQYKKSLEKLKSDVAFGVKIGKFAKVDLLKVEYSLKNVEAKIKEVEENQKNLKVVLETLIGKEVKTIEPYRVDYSPKSFSLSELYRNCLLYTSPSPRD
jgi:outer membrane protein